MPCEICGATTQNPQSKQHKVTQRHLEALENRQSVKNLILKITTIGSDNVGMTTLISLLSGDRRYGDHGNVSFTNFEMSYSSYNEITIKVQIAIMELSKSAKNNSRTRKQVFRSPHIAFIIFDINDKSTLKEALYWLLLLQRQSEDPIPIHLIANTANTPNVTNAEISEESVKTHTLALSYLYDLHIGYHLLKIEKKYRSKDAISKKEEAIQEKLFPLINSNLQYHLLRQKDDINSSKIFRQAKNRGHGIVMSMAIFNMTKIHELMELIKDTELPTHLRLLALKRIKTINPTSLDEIETDNVFLKEVITHYSHSDDDKYLKEVILGSDSNILSQIVALDLINSNAILKTIILTHEDILVRNIALSRIDQNQYAEFIKDYYCSTHTEREKELILNTIQNNSLLSELVIEEQGNRKQLEMIIDLIDEIKQIQVLRLQGPSYLQEKIKYRLQDLSE